MKKSHLISILTGIIVIFGVIVLYTPGDVAASDSGRQLFAVTLTPSDVPADTNTPEPDPPTNTPEPDPPTNTPEPDPPTSTPEPSGATATAAPNTPVPTARPNPGGDGNLGLISFWAFIGGLVILLVAMAAMPLFRTILVKTGSAFNLPTDSAMSSQFARRWLLALLGLMVLGMLLGYFLVNFI